MSSTKPQKKSVKIEGLQIKTEKDALHPLSHYVDDRVELVKQIFSALKAKTIRNLAPAFLKDNPMEELEELCLNELLGLSTKRLLSIINATKCPTDTESSSDSDVHNIEEHISLEEISSDSETETNHNGRKPKKAKKDRTAKEKQSQNNAAADKGVSVLELLELQARARAIRSQLALEPIAKIEVDSDDSTDKGTSRSALINCASSSKGKNNNETANSRDTFDKKLTNGTEPSLQVKQTKRVKLKRNFRRSNREDDDVDCGDISIKSDVQNNKQNENVKENHEKKSPNSEKSEQVERRSPTPDVITILPSPETLCISDSSDEDVKEAGGGSNAAPKHITVPKDPVSAFVKDESCTASASVISDNNEKSMGTTIPEEKNEEEMEDGEIVDNCEPSERTHGSEKKVDETQPPTTDNAEHKTLSNVEQMDEEGNECDQGNEQNTLVLNSDVSIDDLSKTKGNDLNESDLEPYLQTKNEDCDSSAQNNDDVISLGHDDLDDLQECSKDEITVKDIAPNFQKTPNQSSDATTCEQIDNDIITLDNSSDEESTLNQFSEGNQVSVG